MDEKVNEGNKEEAEEPEAEEEEEKCRGSVT